jgi:peptidoglycan L-alanyl-D-glutamate endopeptidase CwlK
MASRNPQDLVSAMYILWQQWDAQMKALDIDYILTCTLRTQAEQNVLYQQGRTAPGPIVTWTLHSQHLVGKAFDFCIMNNGKCDWQMNLKDQWNKAVEIGNSLGMTQVVNSEGKILEFAHLQIA